MELGYLNIERTAHIRGMQGDMEARVARDQEAARDAAFVVAAEVIEQPVVVPVGVETQASLFARLGSKIGQLASRREIA